MNWNEFRGIVENGAPMFDHNTQFICVLCNKKGFGRGHNPDPLADPEDGLACDNCHPAVVGARFNDWRKGMIQK